MLTAPGTKLLKLTYDELLSSLSWNPLKSVLTAVGTKILKLKFGELLSSFALNCNLRRYSKVEEYRVLVEQFRNRLAWSEAGGN